MLAMRRQPHRANKTGCRPPAHGHGGRAPIEWRQQVKKFLMASAAVALVATPAFAGHNSYPGEYTPGNWSDPNPANQPKVLWAGYSNSAGQIPDDTTTATPTVTNTFTLTGSVAKDCSFSGGSSTSHSIPLGAIGVKNGNDEVTGGLFNQNGDFSYQIGVTSAGCNFNNTVTVSKLNGANGLVNPTPGGYDTNNFTANIPYSIVVGISQATTNQGAGAAGQYTPMTIAAGSGSGSEKLGAWRSNMNITASIPAQPKGLVAGNYSDTITVTLAVDTGA